MPGGSTLEALLRRDSVIVMSGLAVVVLIAAIYTISGIGMNMSAVTMTRMAIEMPGMMMQPAVWSWSYAVLVFLMWWVMMVAMMVPSAAPTILVYAGIARKRQNTVRPRLATVSFLAGYLAAWAGFSVVATTLQWALESLGMVTGMMEIANPVIAGSVMIGAGLYQITPIKEACLRRCQHPVFFLMHHWKPAVGGAFRMGLEHGGYCLGCCWFLMALLFVGGIMNLLWIAGIALFVGVEKLAARHRRVMTLTGAAFVVAGVWMIVKPMMQPV